jgi:hypothetical protein
MSNEKIFHDMPQQPLVGVQVDDTQVSGNDFICYVSALQLGPEDDVESITIHAITGSTLESGLLDMTWAVDIIQDSGLDIWSSYDCLILHDGTLYLAGSANVDKESNPSNGYWDAGFVASVSTSGSLDWINIVSLSSHSENYAELYVTDDGLYAAGNLAESFTPTGELHHGFALLSKFDLGTGDEIYHLGFGSEDYQSGFNCVIVDGVRAFCGGYTNYNASGGGFEAWFTEIDIDDLDGAVTSELPVLLPIMEGAECISPPHMQIRDRRGGRNGSGRF